MTTLATVIGEYRAAWEGHSLIVDEYYEKMVELMSNALLNELLFEYNKLSAQKLWTDSLTFAFWNELLKRVEKADFIVNITWKRGHINDWVADPVAHAQVGYEEQYSLLDNQCPPQYVRVMDDTLAINMINRQSFTHDPVKLFIRPLINAEVWKNGDHMQIIRIYNVESPTEGYTIHKEIFSMLHNPEAIIQAPVKIYRDTDFEVIYLMMIELREKTYRLIDDSI